MKTKIALVLFAALPFLSASAEGGHRHAANSCRTHFNIHDRVELSFSRGSVFIEPKEERGESVEITEDGRLFVNDDEVNLNPDQHELTHEYHERAESVWREVKHIAADGVEVGLEGASLGLKAVGGVFHMILPGYDSDDFDRDMEEAEAKLEAKSQRLEDKAGRLEGRIDELEEVHDSMKQAIPELDGLDWF